MRRTSDLIDALVDLGHPGPTPASAIGSRTCIWLALAAARLALLCTAHGVRPDLAARLQQPMFVVSLLGALATAILAALASFKLDLPESSTLMALVPLPGLVVWVSTISYGCLTDWVSMSADGMRMGEAARCFATLLLTSLPLSIAMLIMLRHAAAARLRSSARLVGLRLPP